MAFRNLIIKERCKLEYSLNYLVCKKGTIETKVLLDEIRLIVILTTQASITTSLIVMLSQKKIKIIFCNELCNPECELISYSNNFYSYRKIKEQLEFIKNNEYVWKRIVQEKIYNQARNLQFLGLNDSYNHLIEFQKNVENNDITNREGHSAKVYFNSLFGNGFSRSDDNVINKYLNYGYAIILSCINREIKSLGYLTELGIHHIGESNSFNFSCDLIEPLRPLIDSLIIKKVVNEENYKVKFIELLTTYVSYNNQAIILDNAIHLYIINIINYLKTSEEENLKFIEYEL